MIKRNGDNVCVVGNNQNSHNHNQCDRTVPLSPAARSSAVSLSYTRIPRAFASSVSTVQMTPSDGQNTTKEANVALSTYVEKWKNRYEEAERKNKTHLLKAEKAKREQDELQRRYTVALEERRHLESQLSTRERELNKLRVVSEQLFNEYQQLKHRSELDSQLMQKVMQQAGEWYKQNKQLKRRSTAILNALPSRPPELDITDSNDTESDTSSNEEVEFLKQCASELSQQVAALQTELSTARLAEFETQEANVQLAQELEAEREKSSSMEKELSELRNQVETHNRVSRLLMEEVTALKQHADKDREMAETYKTEALSAKKRVKLLTHQSALLMGDLEMDERLMTLLGEVDNLRDVMESQAQRHREQIDELQLKLTEKHEDTDILVWEEKIRLAEDDARKAIERAEMSERKLAAVQAQMQAQCDRPVPPKRGNLMNRITYFESGGERTAKPQTTASSVKEVIQEEENAPLQQPSESKSPTQPPLSPQPPVPPQQPATPALSPQSPALSPQSSALSPQLPPPPPPLPPSAPIPPPPPPPPAPPAVFNTGSIEDMANMLANKGVTLRKTKQPTNGGGAIDAIVDQIKGGKFHLKSRDQNFLEKKPKEEQPEAVKEMLAILGTLRKRRSVVSRPSFVGMPAQPAQNTS